MDADVSVFIPISMDGNSPFQACHSLHPPGGCLRLGGLFTCGMRRKVTPHLFFPAVVFSLIGCSASLIFLGQGLA